MNSASDISLLKLFIGSFLLIIPFLLFHYYKIKLIKSSIIGVIRMGLQLSFVALYLEWIFELNNALLNIAWVLIMIGISAYTTLSKANINWKVFLFPIFISTFTSILIVDAFFLGYIINLDNQFDAQYFIPITGMIIGNSMNHNIVGLSTYFKELINNQELYYFLQINTNDRRLTIRPFITEAVTRGLTPMIASMSVIGLISLPGMMTGQILGGSSPVTAIKYQVMIMLSIFVGCSLNLLFSIMISNRIIFDRAGRLKGQVLR